MKKIVFFMAELLFGAAFVIGAVNLFQVWKAKQANEALYVTLRAVIDQTDTAEEADASESGGYQFHYRALLKENPDLVGWLTIEDTAIDYPVMQRRDEPDYYLHRDFYGESDRHGTLYADAGCTIGESEQVVVYGHHMKDGTMFKGLTKFEDEAFCKTHTIHFDTLEKGGDYQPVLVMTISVGATVELPYHQFTSFDSAEAFDEYFRMCRRHALWVSDELPEYGAQLLTLSTCEYSHKDGRLVVIAREISQ